MEINNNKNNLEKFSGSKSVISGVFALMTLLFCVATVKATNPEKKFNPKFHPESNYMLQHSSYVIKPSKEKSFRFISAEKSNPKSKYKSDHDSNYMSQDSLYIKKNANTKKTQIENNVEIGTGTVVEENTLKKDEGFFEKHQSTIFKVFTLVINVACFIFSLIE